MKMVDERLKQPDCEAGCLFDGFPRTLPQAEGLDKILERGGFGKPVVVDLAVSDDKLLRRLTGRRTCSVGGEIYNVYDAPSKVEGVCDNDGGTAGSARRRYGGSREPAAGRLSPADPAAGGLLPPPGRLGGSGRFGERG